jgi:hypothetical protein
MKRNLFVASVFALAATILSACTAASSNSTAGTVTWGAPLVHSAGQYPRIVVEIDTTKAAWPIQRAVNSWKVPVTFGTCVASVNCVRFTDVNTLGDGRVGLTWRPVSSGPETVTIQLATNPKMNALQTLQDVTHEFGHALGLGHDDIGVMRASVTGEHLTPNAAELARIRAIYLG